MPKSTKTKNCNLKLKFAIYLYLVSCILEIVFVNL